MPGRPRGTGSGPSDRSRARSVSIFLIWSETMQQSSASIGALGAALAKAQAQIANPEKSLTATIISPFPREESRTFRYAPLSSGLDLVRKCLGQHEIATVQTTAMDRETNQIRLTTTLMHSSGEWVSSDWPVCAISETAAPHRLGAALTSARRYALFTLVGIAGEDDVDAPDLPGVVKTSASANPDLGVESPSATSPAKAPRSHPQSKRTPMRQANASLPSEDPASLQERLLAELRMLKTAESLALWAYGALPLKNQLSANDARALEGAFTSKLSELDEGEPMCPETFGLEAPQTKLSKRTVMVISKPARERDRNHLRFVAAQPCLVCGRTPSDAHHIKFAEQRAMGRKVSDKFTVPVCRLHHRELHRRGDERIWWDDLRIDPLKIAAALWAETHPATPTEAQSAEPATVQRIVKQDFNNQLRPEAG